MTAQVWRVDRTLLHKPAWNCHVDCADVVMLADYEKLREALQNILDSSSERVGYYGYPQITVDDDAIAYARRVLSVGIAP